MERMSLSPQEKNNDAWLDGNILMVKPTPNFGRPDISFTDCQEKKEEKSP